MDVRFDGLAVLVTGATRGIGLATAALFLASGARGVCITGRDEARLAQARGELADDARTCTFAASSDDESGANGAVRATIERFGSCDIVINNAGTNPAYGLLADVDLAAVEKVWSVNLRGPLVYARAAWHLWMRDHGGSIVNVSSLGAYVPMEGIGAYNVSKAGLIAMTRQLAKEMAPKVRVNAVAPGIVKTRLARALWEADEEKVAHSYPLQRLGNPEDIAQTITFLASSKTDWITGETVVLDGGALLG